jgi:hypothetical protein
MFKKEQLKKWLLVGWLMMLFSGISGLFWYNEWVYSLPTPLPEKHRTIDIGKKVDLRSKIAADENKPLFIHFYNPTCPCSKFNIPHVRSLVKQFEDKISFAIVVLSDKNYTAEEIQNKFNLKIPVHFDKSIATSCGVYSTPQAVILDSENKLYYRGNYNKSRYCTEKNSSYAKIALDSLINNLRYPEFNSLALTAYGCQLPNCTK